MCNLSTCSSTPTKPTKSKFVYADVFSVTFGVRSYNPHLGRWINRDPIGEQGGENLLGFVGNSPLTLIDIYGYSGVGFFAGLWKILETAGTGMPTFRGRSMKAYRISGIEYKNYALNQDWSAQGEYHTSGSECNPDKDSESVYVSPCNSYFTKELEIGAQNNYLNSLHYSPPRNITTRVKFQELQETVCKCLCAEGQWSWKCKTRQVGSIPIGKTILEIQSEKIQFSLTTRDTNRQAVPFYPQNAIDKDGMPTATSPHFERSPVIYGKKDLSETA